jgi:septin 7
MSDSYLSTQDVNTSHNGFPNGSEPSFGQPNVPTVPIIRKKLMGYVGFANLPNQVHRKSVRKGFQFTVMVVGAFFCPFSASYVSTTKKPRALPRVQASLALESRLSSTPSSTPLYIHPRSPWRPQRRGRKRSLSRVSVLVRLYLSLSMRPRIKPVFTLRTDIEENGVRLHLTVVDTPGFGDFVNNDDR